ncbi:MAG: MBL fold metallo-hydrolase, partial [Methanocorpusculum sp.]|nr:MBL fold metallo-hydrolase [Methanocorpusculum sp.]
DTIFPNGSFGRTDLPTGSHEDMVKSINRLAELKVESIWPGHETPVLENGKRDILLSQAELKNYA